MDKHQRSGHIARQYLRRKVRHVRLSRQIEDVDLSAKWLVFFIEIEIWFYKLLCSGLVTRTTSSFQQWNNFFVSKIKSLANCWRIEGDGDEIRDCECILKRSHAWFCRAWVYYGSTIEWLLRTKQKKKASMKILPCQQFSTVSFMSNLLVCVLSEANSELEWMTQSNLIRFQSGWKLI